MAEHGSKTAEHGGRNVEIIIVIDDDATILTAAQSRPTPPPQPISVSDGPPWLYVSDDALASLSTDDADATP